LPTLNECSYGTWSPFVDPYQITTGVSAGTVPLDFWSNSTLNRIADNALIDVAGGTLSGSRIADDVILTNVIGFDVKVWDPNAPVYSDGSRTILPGDPDYATYFASKPSIGTGAYVDLGYRDVDYSNLNANTFAHRGRASSSLNVISSAFARVYDTYSTSYETSGTSTSDTRAGRSTNGFDDLGNNVDGSPVTGVGTDTLGIGIVDDDSEKITSPPYPVPLRGIQVKIRVFEPDSRQIREVTVVQDFLPK
jgi:hypothetical protein